MDRIFDLPPRSASMPSPGADFPLSAAAAPPMLGPIPRKLSGRRDSEMVLSDGPITPPESPSPEEMAVSHSSTQIQSQNHNNMVQPPLEIVMTDTAQVVQVLDYPVTPVSQVPETPDAMDTMDEDTGNSEQTLSIGRQPVRSLSQENIDLPGTNTLKLTDFNVRGTLGEFAPMSFLCGVQYLVWLLRDWNIRKGASRTPEKLSCATRLSKLLRYENSSQKRDCSAQAGRTCSCRAIHPLAHSTPFHCRPLCDFSRRAERVHVAFICPWR